MIRKHSYIKSELEEVHNKERQLWSLIYSCEDDMLREALCLLSGFFHNICMVVFDKHRKILATSVDDMSEQFVLQKKISVLSLTHRSSGYNGQGKRYAVRCLLPKSSSYESYLYMEYTGKRNLAEERMYACLYDALAVATKMYRMQYECRYAAETDNLTGVKRRSGLLDLLRKTEQPEQLMVSGIRVIDLREHNLSKGMVSMDSYLSRLAKLIKHVFQTDVFRISGSSFCVVAKRSEKDCGMLLQDVLDVAKDMDERISLACVAMRFTQSPEKSVYLCEKALKEISTDTIRIYKQPLQEQDFDGYTKVEDTVLVVR